MSVVASNGDVNGNANAAAGPELVSCETCGTMVADMSMNMHLLVGCRGRDRPTAASNNNNNKLVSNSNLHDDGNNNNNINSNIQIDDDDKSVQNSSNDDDDDDDVIDLSSPLPAPSTAAVAAAAAASRKRSDEDPSSPQPRQRQRRRSQQNGRLKRDADYHTESDDSDVEMVDAPQQQLHQPEVVDLMDSEDDGDNDIGSHRRRQENNSNSNNDEWSCSSCTLINDKAASSCEACGGRNPAMKSPSSFTAASTSSSAMGSDDIRTADPVRRERLVGGPTMNDYGYDEQYARHQGHEPSGNAGSPLSVVGRGALLGGVLGAAGNYMRGRPLAEGALRGATVGAMSGVFANEMMARSPDQPSNVAAAAAGASYRTVGVGGRGYSSTMNEGSPLSRARSAGANGLPAYPVTSHQEGVARRSSRQPRQSFRVSQVDSHNGFTTTTVQTSGNRGATRVIRRTRPNQARPDPALAYLIHSMTAGGGSGPAARAGVGNNIDHMSYEQILQAFGDGSENLGASVGDISVLPTSKVQINPSTGKVDLPSDNCECSICLEEFEVNQVRKTLPCLHGFHEGCIDKWLHTNGVCPVCKCRVDQRSQS